MSKLKKKDKTRSQEISVSSHPTTANICRNDSNNKVVGLQTNPNLISYILIAFRKSNVIRVLTGEAVRETKHIQNEQTPIYVGEGDTRILLVCMQLGLMMADTL